MMHWLRLLLYRLTLSVLRLLPRGRGRDYRLVVLKLDRLGDAVLALGAVRLLIREYGASETLLIVSTVGEPLFRREFPNVELLVMPPFCAHLWPDFVQTMARYAPQLRAIRAEHLVCLRHQASDYLHAIAALVQARQVHASHWKKSWERVCLGYPDGHLLSYPEQAAERCLELEAHRRVVEGVLGSAITLAEIMPALPGLTVVDGGALLVCPVAGDALRQYPAEHLAEAIRLFLQQWPGVPVQFCLPPGADRKEWEGALRNGSIQVAQWFVPHDLEALVHIIARARVVLAPESAPAHIATALDKPGVFLLGGGHFGMFAPWRKSERQIWLHHVLHCYHCQWRCTQPEPYCITHIEPGDVARGLAALCGSAAVTVAGASPDA